MYTYPPITMGNGKQFLKGALPALALAMGIVFSLALASQTGVLGLWGGSQTSSQNSNVTGSQPNTSINFTSPVLGQNTKLHNSTSSAIAGSKSSQTGGYSLETVIETLKPTPIGWNLVYVLLAALLGGLLVFAAIRHRVTENE